MKIKLIRTSLMIVTVAGVTVISLQMNQLKNKITGFRATAIAQSAAREKAEADLVLARQEGQKTALTLRKTAAALEAKNVEVAMQAQQMTKLTGEAQKLRQERNDAQAELSAYRVSMPSPEQVANAARQIKALEDSIAGANEENALLVRRIKKLQQLVPYAGTPIILPAELRAKVLTVDPKWRFIVLDAGEHQGTLEHGELLISRSGRLVAKVRVSRVEKNRCIANPISGWELTALIEGDQAMPADPKS